MDSTGSKPILLISPLPPPLGGIATWTRILCQQGLPDKNPLSLVNTRLWGGRNIFDSTGFSAHEFLRTIHIICSLFYQLILNRPKLVHISCALSPAGVMRDRICAAIACVFSVPVVTQYHGSLPDFDGKRFFGRSDAALRALMNMTDINIVTNQASFQRAKHYTRESGIVLLPNFIEDEIFHYQKSTHTHARCQAIFAGGMTRAKGCAEIMELARRFPEMDFHLYGKVHADMAEAEKQHPQNVFIHGAVSREHLLDAMCQSDFLLFPSHTEGFPLTVLEAMTIGLPVIATRVGAIPEMISEGEGGYLVERGDIASLANAVSTLRDNVELRNKMGAFNQQKSYREYRYTLVMQKLQAIYGKILCAE